MRRPSLRFSRSHTLFVLQGGAIGWCYAAKRRRRAEWWYKKGSDSYTHWADNHAVERLHFSYVPLGQGLPPSTHGSLPRPT
ncbi:hypothetical protein WMY93_015484 [Mugilogobius chulae]|uniref:Secreted protein n=1 Tax=Mugilogobius chulae TaxID=88201 RepID=A0AAW0NRD2_9GOBI